MTLERELMRADVIIIGAGIAGCSLAANLLHKRVIVLDQAEQPGVHATGRSAAIFSASYGNAGIRALSRTTLPFLAKPPTGFSDYPLLAPRGILYVARDDQLVSLAALQASEGVADVTIPLNAADVHARLPILRDGYAKAGLLEPDAHEIDVNGLLAGYVRQMRSNGVQLVLDAAVTKLVRHSGAWVVTTRKACFQAPIIVNAAGSWAETVGALANAHPIGFEPRQRTAVLVDPPQDAAIGGWPMAVDADEEFYFKPDAGRILLSPADETLCEPCDAQPEELDVAIAVHRVEQATTLSVKRVFSSWAGLRTFAPDRSLVIGFDPASEGFFWLCGQGGYGIQTCHAAALAAAALIDGQDLPGLLLDAGLTANQLSPERFSLVKERRVQAMHTADGADDVS